MKTYKPSKQLLFPTLFLLTLNSCAWLAREIFLPNRCLRCEIRDDKNTVVWSDDDCGGGIHNMELKMKAKAFDLGCNHTLRCEKYRKGE